MILNHPANTIYESRILFLLLFVLNHWGYQKSGVPGEGQRPRAIAGDQQWHGSEKRNPGVGDLSFPLITLW
jgi:hypothetical protein